MNVTAVRSTGGDAVRTKCSMVDRGYMKDDFVKFFYDGKKSRRCSPLINRGTHFGFVRARDLSRSGNVLTNTTPTRYIRQNVYD